MYIHTHWLRSITYVSCSTQQAALSIEIIISPLRRLQMVMGEKLSNTPNPLLHEDREDLDIQHVSSACSWLVKFRIDWSCVTIFIWAASHSSTEAWTDRSNSRTLGSFTSIGTATRYKCTEKSKTYTDKTNSDILRTHARITVIDGKEKRVPSGSSGGERHIWINAGTVRMLKTTSCFTRLLFWEWQRLAQVCIRNEGIQGVYE